MATRKTKSKKGFYFYLLMILVFSISIYVFNLQKVKSLYNVKNSKEEDLRKQLNEYNRVLVAYQQMSSEERIVKFATDSLGLIKSDSEFDKLIMNDYELKELLEKAGDKYDF